MAPTCARVIFAAGLLKFVSIYFCVPVVYQCLIDGDSLSLLDQPLFLDYSLKSCVAIVKWRCTSSNYFLAFLLLCGDVASNPGPNIAYPCGFCKAEVSADDPAVLML